MNLNNDDFYVWPWLKKIEMDCPTTVIQEIHYGVFVYYIRVVLNKGVWELVDNLDLTLLVEFLG